MSNPDPLNYYAVRCNQVIWLHPLKRLLLINGISNKRF